VLRSHLPAIQRLTSTLLQVKYPDNFFSGVVDEVIPARFSRVALSMSKPIGWIRCRLDPFPEQTSPPSNAKPIYNRIYVQALCLLAPYRGQGVATALLESILKPRLLAEHDIESVYAHVWECNADALEWYAKRGFHQVVLVDNYYRKLRPGGAWIVKKDLR
jgi:N-alpha-acetyltransferase 50